MGLGSFLAGVYALAHRLRITELSFVKPIFRSAYFFYKRHEDPLARLVQRDPRLFTQGHSVDVGANIGYTAIVLASGLRKPFSVFAFEPEPANFRQLSENVKRFHLQAQVVPLNCAVGSEQGRIDLWLNANHHADHRVMTPHLQEALGGGEQTVAVEITSLDSFADSRQLLSSIGFVKIDVQGYELPICQGMKQVLRQSPQVVVCIEFEPQKMADLGFDPEDLLRFFRDQDFLMYRLDQKGVIRAVDLETLRAIIPTMRNYFYLLFSKRPLTSAA